MSWESTAEYYRFRGRQVHGLDVHGLDVLVPDAADRRIVKILLGCTEIELLVGPGDSDVPLFDTTRLHAPATVELALDGTERGAQWNGWYSSAR